MTNDPLDHLWNSAPNRPSADAGARLAAHFVSRLRRRRQLQGWWLGWTFFALAGATALALAQVVKHGPGAVAAQWALWPILVLPWGAAVFLLQRFRREGAPHRASPVPLRDALIAAQAGNLAERRRLLAVAILLAAMLPIAAVAVHQLYAAGKASADEACSMGLVFGLGLSAGGAIVAWRFRRSSGPERRQIEALLRDLESSPST